MKDLRILIVGGGSGGLTSAIALGKDGHDVAIVEKDPDWTVYGVGIIQQSNVIRTVARLGVVDDYIEAGFGFDQVDVSIPIGTRVATIPSPRLVAGYPANVGIGRRALHKVLGDRARRAGATIRLGIVATAFVDDGDGRYGRGDVAAPRDLAGFLADPGGARGGPRRRLLPPRKAAQSRGAALVRLHRLVLSAQGEARIGRLGARRRDSRCSSERSARVTRHEQVGDVVAGAS